ncbi:HAD-IIIC family phosphatase [Bradyrhizobium ontarionense]|uniref:HAD-IIIC family phosphatase n=1 Tax=Bradyrhizobium ontarionense TaxID=2898149 RepID=A0ABY3RA77_9BRAD|nr:HAD-IIIC family phosphatase [Bradyrhizobium sp. A19]UFZ04099.1 HAD-IIIC family phosphatase [Bradyrhizobium sp. A19]
MTQLQSAIADLDRASKDVKCVIWDLDNTLWDGVLLERDAITLKPGIREVIQALDRRGILHSIASKNDHDLAMRKLQTFELDEYFLAPEIGWNAKSISIRRIQESLNLGLDSFLFVDDQPFERAEVGSTIPAVRCLDAAAYLDLPRYPALQPRFVTVDSARRRLMCREQLVRRNLEDSWEGPHEEFLASLGMVLTVAHPTGDDLRRAEELTIRTNQLNATGRSYSYDELQALLATPEHELFICELSDRFGSYGKIGLSLLEHGADTTHLRLLLVSCRVMSHGVGSVLLSLMMQRSKECGRKLRADFVDTGRNRMMMVAYRFAGFQASDRQPDGSMVMTHDLTDIPPIPSYIDVRHSA